MTCIVAIKNERGVFIGGDSQATSGSDCRNRVDPKVFKKDGMIFGFTSSYRMGQIIRYSLKIPRINYDVDVFEYMCSHFILSLRECLKEHGYLEKDKNVDSGGTFIVGILGRIFRIENDFQVSEISYDFDSCGCGSSYAIGALSQIKKDTSAHNKIKQAINAAAEFSGGVGGRVDIVELIAESEKIN